MAYKNNSTNSSGRSPLRKILIMIAALIISVAAALGIIFEIQVCSDLNYISENMDSGDYSAITNSGMLSGHSEEFIELYGDQDTVGDQYTSAFLQTLLQNTDVRMTVIPLYPKVKMTFTAPDMAAYIADADAAEFQDEALLADDLVSYCQSEKKVTTSVWVPLKRQDGKWTIEMTDEFYDAMLGGLVTGYQEYYQRVLDAFMEAQS